MREMLRDFQVLCLETRRREYQVTVTSRENEITWVYTAMGIDDRKTTVIFLLNEIRQMYSKITVYILNCSEIKCMA